LSVIEVLLFQAFLFFKSIHVKVKLSVIDEHGSDILIVFLDDRAGFKEKMVFEAQICQKRKFILDCRVFIGFWSGSSWMGYLWIWALIFNTN